MEKADGVYLYGPITGYSLLQVTQDRKDDAIFFMARNVKTFSPMRGQEEELKGEMNIKGDYGLENPLLHPTTITTTDLNDIRHCPAMFGRFLGSPFVSTGSVIEVGFGYALQKFISAAIEVDNIHCTPKFLSCLTYRSDSVNEARGFCLEHCSPGWSKADGVYLRGEKTLELHPQFERDGIKVYQPADVQAIKTSGALVDFARIRESRVAIIDLRGHETADVDSLLDIGYAAALNKIILIVVEQGSKARYDQHPMIKGCASAPLLDDLGVAKRIAAKHLMPG